MKKDSRLAETDYGFSNKRCVAWFHEYAGEVCFDLDLCIIAGCMSAIFLLDLCS